MMFDLECPLDAVSAIFESSTLSTGMTREAPGGVFIELRQFPRESRGGPGLGFLTVPLVHLVVTTGKEVAVGVFSTWLVAKLTKSRMRHLRINRKTVEYEDGIIKKVVEETIEADL